VLVEIAVLRKFRNAQVQARKRRSHAWCREAANRDQLATAHSQVAEALARAAALGAAILLHSLSLGVHDCQWQPSESELRHQSSTANLSSAADPSTSLTPRPDISAAYALHELSSCTRVCASRPACKPTAEQRENRLENDRLRRKAALTDAPYRPWHSSELSDTPEQKAKRVCLDAVAQRVVDCTTTLRDKDHLLDLLRKNQISELDLFNSRMRKYYEFTEGGIDAVLGIHNVGANPSYARSPEFIERVMLHRLVAAIATMVIHPLCVFECTVL